MKIHYVILISVLFSTGLSGQYFKRLAKDSKGDLLINDSISLKLSLVIDSITEPPSYVELFKVKTNEKGFYSFRLRNGKSVIGNLDSLDREVPKYFGLVERYSLDKDEYVTMDLIEVMPTPLPPPPTPPSVYKVVEEMPRFMSCDSLAIGTEKEWENCTTKNFDNYIYSNLEYPKLARENKVQGICIVSFVINEDGTISDIKLVKGLGSGCDEEVLRVIQKMKNDPELRWTPGRQSGKNIKILKNIPIQFRLN